MFPPKNDYISLNINDQSTLSSTTRETSKKSLWRKWNQLSRFQRTILYLLLITIIFILFNILPNKNKTNKNDNTITTIPSITKKIINNNNNNIINNNQVIDEPDFQQYNNINDIDDDKINDNNDNDNEKIIKPIGIKFSGPKNKRQIAVVNAFKHSWNNYCKYAWGHDNIKPISRSYSDWFGLGLTIVDSLDTMYIMGLNDDFNKAKKWINNSLIFNIDKDVNLFEVTIRVLGGLLSIYNLSGDKLFLDKAIDLGNRMLPAFTTKSGVPYSDVNLGTKSAHSPKWGPDSSTSEVTSLQLEFRELSRSSGQPKFEAAVAKVSEHVHNLEKKDGLVPIFINANTGLFREYATITLGARGDSYYEYLLKQWLQTGQKIDYLKDDYMLAIYGIQKHLIKKTAKNKYIFIAELIGTSREMKPKMDHLVCYLPGTLALGSHNGLSDEHMELAKELTKTCYQTYAIQPTFLAPEITYFNVQSSDDDNQMDMYVKTTDAHNLLRPEFIETLYYMWYFTGNKTYQDWGWKIFQAFENYTKVDYGYTSIGNVRNTQNVRPRDMTESFWFGETLKYLYLLFDDERKLIDLDKWVFNSEGHPLPIYDS